MPDLRDYLDLRPTAAREQRVSIISRKPVAEGSRQVAFLSVETLTCLAASLLANHRQYGGSTAHRAVEPVPTLARLFQRPNSSVLAKMANLDGSRRNGAKLLLLGQRELDETDIATAVRPAVEVWRASRTDLDERTTERLLMAAVRVGQHRFASEVLRNHGHRCVFCGLSVSLPEKRAARMLIASHIKPWRECTHAERLDARNGLTACPTYDVAFDTGLMTVNGGLRIHLKPALAVAVRADPAARAAFGRPPLAERLILPDDAAPPDAKYLAWHLQHIFDEAVG